MRTLKNLAEREDAISSILVRVDVLMFLKVWTCSNVGLLHELQPLADRSSCQKDMSLWHVIK